MKFSLRASIEQGFLGLIDTALPIAIINLTGGMMNAIKAGLIQFFLTFTMIFVNTVIFQYFYTTKKTILAIIIPTLLTTTLSFLIHTVAKSPEPLFSAIAVFIMALWYYLILKVLSDKYNTISITKLWKIFIKYLNKS